MRIFNNSITLESRETLEEYLFGFEYRVSGLTFTSLYMWRNINEFSWEIIGDYLCIAGVNNLADNAPFLLTPLTKNGGYDRLKLAETIYTVRRLFEEKGCFFNIMLTPLHMLEIFAGALPGKLRFETDRSNFDYVYNTKDLIELKGRDYHGKRNHLNYFLNNCSFEYVEMSSDMAADALNFIHRFNIEKHHVEARAMDLLRMEEEALGDVFRNLDAVGYLSGAILVNGNLEALCVGGRLGKNTVAVHVEKANTRFRGLYQAINNVFCKHSVKHAEYINREEDMGMPGLRKSKMSYKPCMFIEKYRVCFLDDTEKVR